LKGRNYLPLLFFSVLILSATTATNVFASNQQDDQQQNDQQQQGSVGQQNLATANQGGGEGEIQCIRAPCDDEEEEQQTPPQQQPPSSTTLGQQNLAESNQVGGIGGGNIAQNAQGDVNKQLCSTVGGIGNRQCQQTATPGASNLQDCTAVAGLGKANCVQSENPSGPDKCLTANGQPFICETSTGTSVSGSGQAGQ
jgi:hypothetical protein